MPAAALGEAEVWEALQAVKDPELPALSVVELGIVREVEVEGGRVRVAITPTFSACPALQVMREEITAALQKLGFAEVELETVLAPAWTSDWITPAGREKLERYGIAPPGPAGGGLLQLEPEPVRCPRCGSLDVGLKNSFGPTLCKSLYVCNGCQEPFEAFKAV